MLTLLLAPDGRAADPERATADRRQLTLLVTSGLSGRLEAEAKAAAESELTTDPRVEPVENRTIEAVVAKVRQLAEAARVRGHGVAIIDAGRTLAPYAESRFDAGTTMGEVLAAAGVQAFVPDPIDLDLRASGSSNKAVVDLAASGSFCVLRGFSGATEGLGRLDEVAVLSPFPDLELLVAGRLDPTYLDDLSRQSTELLPLALGEVFERADPERRALRLAVSHAWAQDGTMTGREETWDLLESEAPIDLVLDPDLGRDLVIRRLRKSDSLFLVGRRHEFGDSWTVAEITLDLRRHEGRWALELAQLEIHPIEASPPHDTALAQRILDHLHDFRFTGGKRFPQGAASPESFSELRQLVLETMRERAVAEVAILNRGALRNVAASKIDCCPFQYETVQRLLSIDQFLEVGEITGEQLRALYEESTERVDDQGQPRPNALLFAGLSAVDSKFEVNGRELRETDDYRVVTTTFLGRGGDNYPILTDLEGEVLKNAEGKPLEVRDEVVIPRLERPEDAFVDLRGKGLWRFGVDRLKFSFDGVDTSADPAYQGVSDSRANAGDSSTLHSTLELRADQEWNHFSWENLLEARLRLVDDDDGAVSEAEDDLRFESSGVFTKTRWLGARPYASFIFDSELRPNRNSNDELLPHQLELNLTGGLRWKLRRWPQIRVGWQARRQKDAEEADLFGVFGEAEWSWPLGENGPELVGNLYTERMVDSTRTLERLDLEVELLFEITEHLSLSPAFNLYLYADSRLPGHAEYRRFSIGLTYRWSGKYQRR